jgi:exoribonuclease-2
MNVFYEDEGTLKVASVLADHVSSLHVETPHGKRAKIKAHHVLLKFERPTLHEFMSQAQDVAAELDADFLWECAGSDEFDFTALAREYFGDTPNDRETAGLLMRLHSSPMHFYKKGRGTYKPAPKEALEAAKRSVERKRLQAEQQARYEAQLKGGVLPEQFIPMLPHLLYRPDKTSIEWKALEAVSEKEGFAKFLHRIGAVRSPHDYHVNRFLFEYFPHGTGFPEFRPHTPVESLPIAEAQAFSIDDITTTEIDDAFSVARLANGNWRIGVHIAAPALAIRKGGKVDQIAAKRLSTVYMPGSKITMLPPELIARFSLDEENEAPALSLYTEADRENLAIVRYESRIERVRIAANLRHAELDHLDEHAFEGGMLPERFAVELKLLWRFALRLEESRGKPSTDNVTRTDYNFYVEGDTVRIVERRRGTPVDKLVSELMILVNFRWAQLLSENGIDAVYRGQESGKIKFSTSPLPHDGLNVSQYVWASSPLRRYVDLINQRQIIAHLSRESPPYQAGSEALLAHMRDFELAHEAYCEFQRTMERYWCLRWLIQENITSIGAEVVRENLVKLDHLPLFVKVFSLPSLSAGSRVEVTVRNVDLFNLSLHCEYRRREEAAA